MDILIISLAALAILSLIAVWAVVRSSDARSRRINAVKTRNRARDTGFMIAPVEKISATTITYDTTAAGLEVDEDLTEEQANVIRMIFEDNHPAITIRNHKEDFWATTERMGL
jgi:hypothetical protein